MTELTDIEAHRPALTGALMLGQMSFLETARTARYGHRAPANKDPEAVDLAGSGSTYR